MTAINVGYIRSRPQSEPVYGTNCRRLIAPFLYHDSRTGKYILIPKGFIWDGTSIPRFLWSFMGGPFSPMYEIAGLVHDFLYRKFDISLIDIEKELKDLQRLISQDAEEQELSHISQMVMNSLLSESVSRKTADQIFSDILSLEQVHWFRAWDMYYGVRAGG